MMQIANLRLNPPRQLQKPDQKHHLASPQFLPRLMMAVQSHEELPKRSNLLLFPAMDPPALPPSQALFRGQHPSKLLRKRTEHSTLYSHFAAHESTWLRLSIP